MIPLDESNWVEFFPSLSEMPENWPGPAPLTEAPEGIKQIEIDVETFSPTCKSFFLSPYNPKLTGILDWSSPAYTGRRNKSGYLVDNSN